MTDQEINIAVATEAYEPYERAVEKLYAAACEMVLVRSKSTKSSSFAEWYDVCEALEQAAVEFAKVKATQETQ